MFGEIRVLVAWLTAMVWQIRHRRHNERGEIVSWVILTAIIAAGAITIGWIIVDKLTSKAESTPTG